MLSSILRTAALLTGTAAGAGRRDGGGGWEDSNKSGSYSHSPSSLYFVEGVDDEDELANEFALEAAFVASCS